MENHFFRTCNKNLNKANRSFHCVLSWSWEWAVPTDHRVWTWTVAVLCVLTPAANAPRAAPSSLLWPVLFPALSTGSTSETRVAPRLVVRRLAAFLSTQPQPRGHLGRLTQCFISTLWSPLIRFTCTPASNTCLLTN